MTLNDPAAIAAWQLFSRLGEAQILLPATATVTLALWRQHQGRMLAAWWLALLAAAALLTTASKVAFIGWGIGSAALDFTGISGHAMFAAAVYPLLLGALAPAAAPRVRWLAVATGALLALLIGISRVLVQAHSVSEVLMGLALGGAVGVVALLQVPLRVRISPWLAPLTGLWLASTLAYAPPSQTHPMVTRLALVLSGRAAPHTRQELHAGPRAAQAGSTSGVKSSLVLRQPFGSFRRLTRRLSPAGG